MSRKKIWLVSGTIFVAAIVVFALLVTNQSPLKVNGITRGNDENKMIVLELLNNGYFDVELIDVMVNNNFSLQKVELGVSHSLHLMSGGGLDEDPYIKFVPITDQKIKPDLSPEEKIVKNESKNYPIHYGIRIISNDPITQVKVKYKYFGYTYTKMMELDNWPQSNF